MDKHLTMLLTFLYYLFTQCGVSDPIDQSDAWTEPGATHLESSENESTSVSECPMRMSALETWRPNINLPSRKFGDTDWSGLKEKKNEWEIKEFSGGTTVRSRNFKYLQDDRLNTEYRYTPRQQQLYDSINLQEEIAIESLTNNPSIQIEFLDGLSPTSRQRFIVEMFRSFVVELTRGSYFTQLTSEKSYVTLYCQLNECLDALSLDQNSGRRIEFPLKEVNNIYVITRPHQVMHCPYYDGESPDANKNRENLKIPRLDLTHLLLPNYLVVVEFLARKLAFVFKDASEANRFKFCLQLLTKYVVGRNNKRTCSTYPSCRYPLKQCQPPLCFSLCQRSPSSPNDVFADSASRQSGQRICQPCCNRRKSHRYPTESSMSSMARSQSSYKHLLTLSDSSEGSQPDMSNESLSGSNVSHRHPRYKKWGSDESFRVPIQQDQEISPQADGPFTCQTPVHMQKMATYESLSRQFSQSFSQGKMRQRVDSCLGSNNSLERQMSASYESPHASILSKIFANYPFSDSDSTASNSALSRLSELDFDDELLLTTTSTTSPTTGPFTTLETALDSPGENYSHFPGFNPNSKAFHQNSLRSPMSLSVATPDKQPFQPKEFCRGSIARQSTADHSSGRPTNDIGSSYQQKRRIDIKKERQAAVLSGTQKRSSSVADDILKPPIPNYLPDSQNICQSETHESECKRVTDLHSRHIWGRPTSTQDKTIPRLNNTGFLPSVSNSLTFTSHNDISKPLHSTKIDTFHYIQQPTIFSNYWQIIGQKIKSESTLHDQEKLEGSHGNQRNFKQDGSKQSPLRTDQSSQELSSKSSKYIKKSENVENFTKNQKTAINSEKIESFKKESSLLQSSDDQDTHKAKSPDITYDKLGILIKDGQNNFLLKAPPDQISQMSRESQMSHKFSKISQTSHCRSLPPSENIIEGKNGTFHLYDESIFQEVAEMLIHEFN